MTSRKRSLRVIGLLSGTSMDGVDAAVMRISGSGPTCRVALEGFRTFPFPKRDRLRLLAAAGPGRHNSTESAKLSIRLGTLFARAALRIADAHGGREKIDLIGSHGQTMLHIPGGREGASVQIGGGPEIAARTGIPVVYDFRAADIAAGGEGAPLLPITDFLIFGGGRRDRMILNIGGIANLTFLPAGGAWEDTVAYDTGPGNALIDRLVHLETDGARRCDSGGRGAARGRTNSAMLQKLMSHSFLKLRPPRSTGTEEFGDLLARKLYREAKRKGIGQTDLLATVTEYTAASAGGEIRKLLAPGRRSEIHVCGGGARNRHLIRLLGEKIGSSTVRPMDDLGIPADAREAVGFGLLASEFIHGNRYSMKHITGAKGASPLGVLALAGRPASIALSRKGGTG